MANIIVETEVVKPGVVVVHLAGDMDEESLDPIKEKVDPYLNDEQFSRIIFNFTQLKFINSKGIGYLVSVHTHLSKMQHELVLAAANETVMDVISLVGLTSIVRYFETLEEAIGGGE